MPQYKVEIPGQGTFNVDSPEELTDAQVYAAVQQQLRSEISEAPQEVAAPTFGGQTKEFFKGLLPGGIGLVEQAGMGISALLPEEQEKATQQYIKEAATTAKAPFAAAPGYEDTIGRKFGEAAGSIVPFLATGPFGMAGRVAGYGLGIGAGAGTQVEKSAAEGATEGQQTTATALGAVVGASEMFAPARILKRIAQPIAEGATAFVKRALVAGGEEAAQEAASQAAQNLITKGVYKPEQEIIEQVGESAAYGGAVGALAQGLLDLALGRRVRGASLEQPAAGEAAPPLEPGAPVAPTDEEEIPEPTLRQPAPEKAGKEPVLPGSAASFKERLEQRKQLEKAVAPYEKEQARIAALTPFDYLMEQTGEVPKPTKVKEGEGLVAADMTGLPYAMKFAKQQIEAAKYNEIEPDVSKYIEYLLTKPDYANILAAQAKQLPGLNAKQSKSVLAALPSALKLRAEAEAKKTAEAEKPAETPDKDLSHLEPLFNKAFEGTAPIIEVNENLMPTRNAKMVRENVNTLLQQADDVEAAYRAARRAGNRAAAVSAFAQKQGILKKLNALTEETPAGDLTEGKQKPPGEIDTRASYAREVIQLRRQQQKALEDIEVTLNTLRAGDVMGREVEPVRDPETGKITMKPVEIGKGAAGSSGAVLAQRAESLRGDYINALLKEAATHRRALGKAPITVDEATKAASRVYDVVNEWIERSKAKPLPRFVEKPEFVEKIVQPAQKRAGKIVRGAVTERTYSEKPPAKAPEGYDETDGKWEKFSTGKPNPPFVWEFVDTRPVEGRFNEIAKLSDKEIKHFKAQIDNVVKSLEEIPSEVSRETPLLKQQFAGAEAKKTAEARGETAATASGEMRRLREYVGNMIDKALTRNIPEGAVEETEDGPIRTQGIKETLERAKEIIEDGKASKTLLDAAQNQAARILRGEDLGKQIYTRRELASTKRVVDNVPGREAETRIGERRTYRQVGYEAALAPEGSALRELQDAIKLYERTAQEGEIAGEGAAGQGQLFPETRKDIGYIRATPANFAKSPQIKPVWEALEQSRKLKAEIDQKAKIDKARAVVAVKEVESLTTLVDNIKANTKFFWADTTKWSNEALAKAFVPYPEIGTTPEEQALVNIYLKSPKSLSEQEKASVDAIIKTFTAKALPKYQEKLKQAVSMLAQGERLNDFDNKLLGFMQDSNKSVREAAEAKKQALAPLQEALERIRTALKASPVLTEAQKDAIGLEGKISDQRAKYSQTVEAAIKKTNDQMVVARDAILNPQIEPVLRSLKAASTRLEKVLDEITNAEEAFDAMLETKDGEERLLNSPYQVESLRKNKETAEKLIDQIQEQSKIYEDLLKQKNEDFTRSSIAVQAMLDKNVKYEREYLEILESQLAFVRGEDIDAMQEKPGERRMFEKVTATQKYPFAARRAEEAIKVQRAALEAAKKRADAFKKETDDTKDKIEKTQKQAATDIAAKLPGIQMLQGEVSKLKTAAEKEAEAKNKAELDLTAETIDAGRRAQIKQTKLDELNTELENLYLDFAGRAGPTDPALLQEFARNKKKSPATRAYAQAKLDLYNQIEILEAQEDALKTGKPFRKPRTATTPSTAALAGAKEFRSGSEDQIKQRQKRIDAAIDKEYARYERLEAKATMQADKEARKYAENLFESDDYIEPSRQSYEFSRGTPSTGLTKAELEAELTAGMGEPVTGRGREAQVKRALSVYENLDDYLSQFKDATRQKLEGQIPSDAKGFVQDGKAVLFANNIAKGEGLGVLLHEVGVHIGFRNFFNQAQYNALVKTVKSWAAREDGSMEARVGKAAMDRVKAAETPANQIDDELLAYAVEEAMKAGVDPEGVKKGSAVQNWLRMVVDAFRKALEKFGINAKNLTAGDLVNFAYGAAHLELKGTWHGTGVEFKEFDHAYMSTGEGHQAFGWGTYRAQQKGIAKNYQSIAADNQTEKWMERPDVKEWFETQKPKFTGTLPEGTPDWILDNALFEAATAPIKLNPYRAFRDTFKNNVEELADLRKDGRPEAAFKDATDAEFKNKLKELEKYAETAAEHLTAVYEEPVYKGRPHYDLFADNPAASDAIKYFKIALAMGKEPSWKNAITEAKAAAEYSMKLFEQTDLERENNSFYERAKKTYNDLDTLDVKDFKYNPPSGPPVPEPVGYLLRTLHTRPENEYVHWDDSADKQPPVVKAVFKRIYDSLTPPQKEFFDRAISTTPLDRQNGQDLYQALSAVFEKSGTPSRLSDRMASEMLYAEGVAGIKFFDNPSRKTKQGTFNYVDFSDKEEGAQIIGVDLEPVGKTKEMLFSRAVAPGFEDALNTANDIIAKPKTVRQRVEANLGLAFRTQVLDRLAPLEQVAKTMLDPLKGTQMMYYLRMADQRMSFVQQAVGRGVPQLVGYKRKDGQTEYLIESKEGVNLSSVVDTLKSAPGMNAEAANKLFTLYLAGKRADRVGYNKLNFSKTEAEIRSAVEQIEGNKEVLAVFEKARNQYNAYNRNLMKFMESTGAMSKEVADQLANTNDYIPYYRERNGNAELVIGGEGTFKMGSLKDQPQLRELIGGEEKIMDFLTSSVENTSIIMDIGLRNKATTNAMFELVDLGIARFVKPESTGPNIVRFKDKGEEKAIEINTRNTDFPADLLVKGLEGIPVNNSAVVRAMGASSTFLRKAITLNPLYSLRQIFRDSVAAPLLSGADMVPLLGALKQIGASATKEKLEARGIVGGQVFTGTNEDLTAILREFQSGKIGLSQLMARAEGIAIEADATTRRAQYDSYIKQGLSEMEATLMSLESMNFNRKGLSPSVRMASTLIPFFNAQLQSLDVLYRAMTGKMPFNERLDIQGKLYRRGMLLAGTAVAYALLMQDDEAYKNANPDEKYGNFFVRLPGLKEPIRVPIPFEIGYIFKALPEAMVNIMANKQGDEEAYKAFKQIALQTIPGGTSLFLPAAVKPIVENVANYSFFTGRSLETKREQNLEAAYRYRDNTSEIVKMIGQAGNVSPIKLENLIRGYTGSMGMALAQSLNMAMPTPKGTPEQATKRLSDTAVIGPLFQPNDAGGIVGAVYDRMTEVKEVKNTFDELVRDGRRAEAKEYLQTHLNDYAASAIAGNAQQQMTLVTQAMNAVKASNLPPDQKREKLDELQALRIKIATNIREAFDRTTPPEPRP
jgi:hypothetical protein